MDKNECINLLSQYFDLESYMLNLKNPDFELKSQILYYKGLFKDIEEIKVLKVESKNKSDDILFDIYYVSKELEGLFHGYFRIQPKTVLAQRIFKNVNKICTDLKDYFYYVYQNSDVFKIYLMSGNAQYALEESEIANNDKEEAAFHTMKLRTLEQIAGYTEKDLQNMLLQRSFLEKYIQHFIELNSKCTEEVKGFLIDMLYSQYSKHICLMHDQSQLSCYVTVSPKEIYFTTHEKISVYAFLEYCVSHSCVVFLKLQYDFGGGGSLGKVIG